jgi:RNA polymerase sigma factor (sigma-70 family)
MSSSSEFLISQEDELALHRRLVDGEVTAFADLAKTFLDPLIKWLVAKNNSNIPEELCIEAAEDALIALVKNPASFKLDRGKRLGGYLCMSARGDLRNLLRDERRHRKKSLEVVELSTQDGKYLVTDDDPSLPLQIQEESEQARREIIPVVSDGLSEGESRVLDLILQGERKTTVFAQALGIDHLPKKEKADEVNRVKNKIKKRIERGKTGDGHES